MQFLDLKWKWEFVMYDKITYLPATAYVFIASGHLMCTHLSILYKV